MGRAIMGIYKIENLITQEIYIGQSIDINRRWEQHKKAVIEDRMNQKLYRNIREYGAENFKFEVLEITKDRMKLDLLEFEYIEKYDSYKNGLNSTNGNAANICRYLLSENNKLKGIINKLVDEVLL